MLDLACGRGRHGRLFLDAGHPTSFLDKNISAVSDLAGTSKAEILAADLETGGTFPLAGRFFGGVIVTCYLHRPILTDIMAAVMPGGVLIMKLLPKETRDMAARRIRITCFERAS